MKGRNGGNNQESDGRRKTGREGGKDEHLEEKRKGGNLETERRK